MKSFALQNNKGFTIIETLVAITILMIAIVGPLTIAHKSLLAAVYAHDQMIASYLAQDVVEYVKNVKANNVASGATDWLEDIRACTSTNLCRVDTLAGVAASSGNTGISACSGTTCVMYKSDDGYNHDSGSIKTHFSRYFYIIPTVNTDEAKLVVKVEWKNGAIDNQVLYESQLYNTSL